MKISQIDITPCERDDWLVALAHITLNDVIRLHMIGIYRRLDGSGFRITYPTKSWKTPHNTFFHPTNPETSHMFEEIIIEAYKNRNSKKSYYARHSNTTDTAQ